MKARWGAAALAAAAALLALAGCGGSDDGRAATPTGATTGRTQPPAATVPGSPRLHRYRPPAIAVRPGRGGLIGAQARLVYTTSTFAQIPLGFVAGGIPVGTTAGDCRVSEIGARDRADLEATTRRQTPRGEVRPLGDDAILLADCGDEGRWAVVTWTQRRTRDDDQIWVDDLRDDGGGRWSGTARGVQPGCRMPRAAAAAFQLDVTVCPPPAPRAPAPRRADPDDPPLSRLPDGSSRA